MKILLASSSSGSRGGGELYLLYLARALVGSGHQVTLWTSSHPRMDELADAFAKVGEVVRSDYRNTYDRPARCVASYCDIATARRVATEWHDAVCDLIHLNKQNLEDGLDLLRAAKLANVPSLCTIHLTQSARYLRAKFASLRDFLSRRALLDYPGLLVTVLDDRRADLVDFIGDSDRLRVIPNGVPVFDLTPRSESRTATRRKLGIPNGAFLVIGIGRMVPQKRPLMFLAYAERIRAEIPDAQFLWVGDGTLAAEWDRVVAARGLGECVQRLPWQSDVVSLLFAADLFLHTAEFEGLPLAVLEAMSAALPCAITENLLGEMPFLDADNSLTVNGESYWISQLRDHSSLRARGAAARKLVEQKFSFEKMAESYAALYREILPVTP